MFGRTAGQFLGTMLPFFSEQTLTQGSPSGGTVIPAAIHFWPMNEGSGTTFFDQIGTTNLTSSNVTYAVTTGLGASSVAQFNGSSSNAAAASVDATLNFNGTQPMTIAFWINPVSVASGSFAGNLQTASAFQGWECSIASSGTNAYLVVGAVTSNQMTAASTTVDLVAGTPALVVITYSGSLNVSGVREYINGSLQTITDTTGTLTSGSTSTQVFNVGARSGTNFYNGALAYMRVWNQVLTPAQVTKLFSNGPQ